MMSNKQQKIEEMARDICRHQNVCNDVCKPISACDALRYAERAVEAGYVKVVRCKECEHYKPVASTCGNCYRTTCIQHTEDYCSYGKPKMKGADNE